MTVALVVTILSASLIAGCAQTARPVQRANPASQNCVQQGGKLAIERGPGGEIGVCLFEDNRQCEEWALLRGLCPAGGTRVTGYATPEERLCAIRGRAVYEMLVNAKYRPRSREAAMNHGSVPIQRQPGASEER